MDSKKISVIGLGYVGLPLALLADKKGYKVVGIDKSKEKINLLSKKISPIKDSDIETQLQNSHLLVSDDFSHIANSKLIIICVPTPVDHHYIPDLTPIGEACENIARHLSLGQTVVLESTVNPGVCEEFIVPILETSGLKVNTDFYLAHCPERINPGDKKWSVANIPRVIGSLNAEGLAIASDFYESIVDAKIFPMKSVREAEAVKVVENSFRDVNIAFVNELAQSFTHLNIDVVNVIDGAATKPFAFMPHYPGCGVGGHCIPVDPYYLIEYAKKHGFKHNFLSWARRVNNSMPEFTVTRLLVSLDGLGANIKGSKIAVLGLAYKANVGDVRESPSYKIIHVLEKLKAEVSVYDPFRPEESAKDLSTALVGANAVIIATDHDLFIKKITPTYLAKMGVKVIVDGKNCLKKAEFQNSGVIYIGIGR